MSLDLSPHRLKIALIRPQIAPNTGNIARLCVATGTELHLVRPLGFVLSDRQLKRSAMDYWPRLKLTVHDDDGGLFRAIGSNKIWMLSSKGTVSLFDADFRDGDWLIFGNEGHGLPESMLARPFTTTPFRDCPTKSRRCDAPVPPTLMYIGSVEPLWV